MSQWPKTLLGEDKQKWLVAQCEEAYSLHGQTAEVGVYQGGTANLIASILPNRKLYLFDTWSGMPEVEIIDGHKEGDFNCSLLETKLFLKKHKNIEYHKGCFPDTINEDIIMQSFSLVHIDVDLYSSTKHAINFFWPRMVQGGIIVFDDYNHTLCKGANLAIDEFFHPDQLQFNPMGGDNKSGLRVVKFN